MMTKKIKGLILSGGFGTRLRPLTYSQQKQLIPVANKPILFYCIEDLIDAGVREIGIVVGPNKEQVMEKVNSIEWDAEIEFIYQGYPHGLAHAVKISKDFLDDDKFVMYLGDNILKGGINKFVEKFSKSKAVANLLLTPVDNPQEYGLALVDEQKKVIVKLVEKPKVPISNLSIVGIYGLTPIIFEAIDNIKPSWRNQLEITDALQWLIDNGYTIEYEMVEGWWKDTGRPEDILEANRLVLDEMEGKIEGKIEKQVVLRGRVKIERGAIIRGETEIKGPCVIGKNSLIKDSYIGPYTSIGDNCKIVGTEIEDSVIMEKTEIFHGGRIINSLIGREVKILRDHKVPNGLKLILGDRSQAII